MATLGKIGGAEPSTLTFELRTVTFNQNSTTMHAEVLVLGDPDTTNALAAVVNTTPGSTAWGLVTRSIIAAGNSSVTVAAVGAGVRMNIGSTAADNAVVVSGNSTVAPLAGSVWSIQGNSTVAPLAGSTWNTRSLSSSKADFLATVYQSTAADLNVTVAGYSTIVTIAAIAAGAGRLNIGSTAADNAVLISGNSTAQCIQVTNPWTIAGNSTVAPLAGSTWATRPIQSSQADLRMTAYQSTAADLNVTVAGYSTIVSANIVMQSSVAPSSASSGVIVRQVIDVITSFASTSALASTSVEVASSVAAVRIYVVGYSITSTNQTPAHWGFFSSNATLLWPLTLAAISSGVTGVNLAVSAPAYLFRTTAAEALNFKSAGTTVAGVQMGVSYFKAP